MHSAFPFFHNTYQLISAGVTATNTFEPNRHLGADDVLVLSRIEPSIRAIGHVLILDGSELDVHATGGSDNLPW